MLLSSGKNEDDVAEMFALEASRIGASRTVSEPLDFLEFERENILLVSVVMPVQQ